MTDIHKHTCTKGNREAGQHKAETHHEMMEPP